MSGERITATPASSERGFLSVLVEAYCEADKLFDVSPGAFRPVPKVWSSVIRLTLRGDVSEQLKNTGLLWTIVSAGFAHRRKTILNNLRQAPDRLAELLKRRRREHCPCEQVRLNGARRLNVEEWFKHRCVRIDTRAWANRKLLADG